MAEIAIPLLVLGGFYVASNNNQDNKKQNKKSCRDNFENINHNESSKGLPNTRVLNQNYPKNEYPIDTTSKNYVKEFINPNQTTDKLFSNQLTLGVGAGDAPINSMSGDKIDINKFEHNNMVPFFGSTVKGAAIGQGNSNILDNLQGSGSTQIKKSEQAPLFKPDDNVQYSHGMPNQSDFIQSRQLPSHKIANVLPWEQEKVAPGLGLGFTTDGAGGFNSGMLDRQAWQPPTVDELRAKTNPKLTYDLQGHQGPAQSKVQNMGSIGKVEKQTPNTDFPLGPQHWLTGTGATLAPIQNPEQMLNDGNRLTTTSQYYGSMGTGGDSKATYNKGHYETSQKPEFCGTEFNPVSAAGHGAAAANDYGAKGYNIPKNNRLANCESQNNGIMGNISGTFKAVMAPVMDVLRPSRKENMISSANLSGTAQAAVPNLPLTNPNERAPTTIKETTVDKVGMNYLNVSHIRNANGAYQTTDVQIKDQERNTCASGTRGYIGGTALTNAPMNVSAWENQQNNVN